MGRCANLSPFRHSFVELRVTKLSESDIRKVVAGAMLAMFLSALDQTIVAPALPPMARDLGRFDRLSWVVTAYLLAAICATPVVGKLSDLYGRRHLVAVCLVVFMAGSVACALATNMTMLILARALQGIGGGGLIPLAQSAIADVVTPRERGRYAAYFSAVWASSAVMGPTLGGLLTEHAGWAWIFWINLPIGVLALLVSWRALRRLPVERHKRPPIEFGTVALLLLGTVSLLAVLSLGGKRIAWVSPELFALATAAVVFCGLFWWRQARSPDPILPPRFVQDSVIGPAFAAGFIVYGGYISILVLAPVYFQVALGTSISDAGLLMIPIMFSSTVTANVTGRFSQRTGRYKMPPLAGLPVAIAALAVLAYFSVGLSPAAASVLFALVGLGVGPMFPCTTVAVQNAVTRRDIGAVSGALAFTRSLGAAFLIAATSGLVLGLVARGLPELGAVSAIEDLARETLPPASRAVIAHAFGVTFAAVAVAFAISILFFLRMEERMLRTHEEPLKVPGE
jgi:EmrB/QacA subfamily drug resistance transporter